MLGCFGRARARAAVETRERLSKTAVGRKKEIFASPCTCGLWCRARYPNVSCFALPLAQKKLACSRLLHARLFLARPSCGQGLHASGAHRNRSHARAQGRARTSAATRANPGLTADTHRREREQLSQEARASARERSPTPVQKTQPESSDHRIIQPAPARKLDSDVCSGSNVSRSSHSKVPF